MHMPRANLVLDEMFESLADFRLLWTHRRSTSLRLKYIQVSL